MSERKISFSVSEFYHLFNRGTEKRNVFLELNDYKRFLVLLFLCNSTRSINIREQFPKGNSFGEAKEFDRGNSLVDIGSYCLMPNHFHLLLCEKIENGITLFLRKLATAYSMYFNRKYKRTGKLFEGVFKATHADNDEYLKYLFAYIHLNPVKLIEPEWKESGIKDKNRAELFLKEYQFSSYLDYAGIERTESIILNKKVFPEYFLRKSDFNNYIKDWLFYKMD